MTTLRLGTRRSPLAMRQAELVRDLLAERGTQAEIVGMTTSGDEGGQAADAPQGLKGLWIDTILDALDDGEIDVAVHSAKDLPAEDEEDVVIAAVPERADPFDVLVFAEPGDLEPGMRVGTSSLRRAAQLRRAFPRIEIVQLRGNVGTRLNRIERGEVDAGVLAAAGLERLGLLPAHARLLSLEEMIPAPGQGALALQTRTDDAATIAALAPLDHPHSHAAIDAERSLMWRVGGGCSLPLGAFAVAESSRVHLTACIASPDGREYLHAVGEGRFAEEAAESAAKTLLDAGAEELLHRAEAT